MTLHEDLRTALAVALWGEDNSDATVTADRLVGVVNKVLGLHEAQHLTQPADEPKGLPWTPEFARQVLARPDTPEKMRYAAEQILKADTPAVHEDNRPEGKGFFMAPTTITAPHQLYVIPLKEDLIWETALGWSFHWDGNRAAFAVFSNDMDEGDEPMHWDRVTLATELTAAQYPIRLYDAEKDTAEAKRAGEAKDTAFRRRIATLRYLVSHLDGDLPFPDKPKGPAMSFYADTLAAIESFARHNGTQALIRDPRGEVASFGYGTPLDVLTVTGLLELAAEVQATSFDYEDPDGHHTLYDAVKATLHRIYEDAWAVVGYGLEQGELVLGADGQIQVAPVPAPEWMNRRIVGRMS